MPIEPTEPTHPVAPIDTDAMMQLLKDVAAEVITPRFRALSDAQIAEKNPGDLVTIADREAEVLLTRAIVEAYPDAVVLGEEAFAGDPDLLDRFAAAEHAFTVDPVDGTKNFVHGSPDHAVMVSESRGGTVERAWIWQPQHDLAYAAERGSGVTRNGEPLTVPSPPDAGGDLRGRTSKRAWIGESLGSGDQSLAPLELTWVCCGVDYPNLVEGLADHIIYGGSRPWDHLPGLLMLQETGGAIGRFDGSTLDARDVRAEPLIAARSPEILDRVRGVIPAGWSRDGQD